MIALTIKAMWAWAIFHAGKDIENRAWAWPTQRLSLPRRILLHTSKSFSDDDYILGGAGIYQISGRELPPPNELITSAIVGAVTITTCVRTHSSEWFAGPYGLTLERPVLLSEPIACSGQRGIWTVPLGVEAAVRAAARSVQ